MTRQVAISASVYVTRGMGVPAKANQVVHIAKADAMPMALQKFRVQAIGEGR